MKTKIKQILNTITPQDLEEGCSRQVEEIEKLFINEIKEYEDFLHKKHYVRCVPWEEKKSELEEYLKNK